MIDPSFIPCCPATFRDECRLAATTSGMAGAPATLPGSTPKTELCDKEVEIVVVSGLVPRGFHPNDPFNAFCHEGQTFRT